jgi:NADP-dependent 3-hydroxy acid dehydrogenase YdfG
MMELLLTTHFGLIDRKGNLSMLENKVCVIYGAGGAIGGAIARGFAREGASVFLAGRTQAKLDKVANDIRAHGGRADTSVVDALDEKQVATYVDSVVKAAGRLDVSVNVIASGMCRRP